MSELSSGDPMNDDHTMYNLFNQNDVCILTGVACTSSKHKLAESAELLCHDSESPREAAKKNACMIKWEAPDV